MIKVNLLPPSCHLQVTDVMAEETYNGHFSNNCFTSDCLMLACFNEGKSELCGY